MVAKEAYHEQTTDFYSFSVVFSYEDTLDKATRFFSFAY